MLVLIAMSYPFTELVIENGADHNNGPSHPSRAAVKRKPTGPVRVVQGFLYVVSSLQLLTALIVPCVIFAQLTDGGGYSYIDEHALYLLISSAFVGICGGLGVVVAKGRSRVRMIILIGVSVLVGVMSSILIGVIRSNCKYSYTCEGQIRHEAQLAIEALILTFTSLGVVGTSILLCMSCIRRNNVAL